jgi:excisionase family DNA binding protein
MSNAQTWLTAAEAADYARVNVVTLRRAVRAGTLLAFRVNDRRNLRFRRSDLDVWRHPRR